MSHQSKRLIKFNAINEEEEEVAKQHLSFMLLSLERPTGSDENTASEGNLENAHEPSQDEAEEIYNNKKNVQFSNRALEKQIRKLNERLSGTVPSQTSPEQHVFPVLANRPTEVTIRKELKICGQIGERGQKHKLTCTNVMNQIDRELNKGHIEPEIIEAVVKAISPGLSVILICWRSKVISPFYGSRPY